MKLRLLKQAIDTLVANEGPDSLDLDVVINVEGEMAIGAHPCVSVDEVLRGFDWEMGRVILQTSESLTRLSKDDVRVIHRSVSKGGSWHAFRRHSKLIERIRFLEAKLAESTKIES